MGTFQTFTDKTYQPLTDEHLIKHLKGEHIVGLYPLLQDNTSWFIAADFDETSGLRNAGNLSKSVRSMIYPAYLERSRSGKGGHVWVFLKNPMKHSGAEK
ncbi:TOTE conflict system archaeo-eukaryotic primase domain-containing protein [Mucilaginibacter pocheonensis]|uniref:TOTE conflict system archaeo-eukaryotic primase domain-containing protein n=1 Tax=Mucilaginibacter pocheonensis TaxID=398050 RepID=UPI0035B51374